METLILVMIFILGLLVVLVVFGLGYVIYKGIRDERYLFAGIMTFLTIDVIGYIINFMVEKFI